MLIIPAIDLRNGQCVRLTQGRKLDVKVYDGDPVEIALKFEAEGARFLHVVDLDGAFDEGETTNRGVVRQIIGAVRTPVEFGGGLRSVHDVKGMIESGVERVVIGTLAVESPESLVQLVELYGSRVAVGIDARDGEVVTRGWEKRGRISALELARRVARVGVERIIYTDVGRDGMLQGINIEQTCFIARESGLKVTASGGVSSLEDIRRVAEASACGIDSLIVGKALYERRFSLKEALEKSRIQESAIQKPE
ncbi:MAG: 1-(5-phosphoribosyl)-5-[(5-phosphoribosylamino)methylideneamino]imidazole-4-carboxamide isomerase [Acidobacteria bacterium]|nr:MAG: 1-(5-phosphoribosyl)-5-[(5-phosphoribosylamino)methylideneamino]imidazole-4-carboxamide isomerase [Acidobacteriota bacterium]